MIRLILAIAVALSFASAGRADDASKVRGVSLAHLHARGAGYGSEACREQLKRIAEAGANWVSITDFAYMPAVDSPDLRFGGDRSMTRDDIVKVIRDAHELGLNVMIKPHIWSRDFHRDRWAGDIRMNTEADWDAWFENYSQYILYNAQIAAETNAAAISVGVELGGTAEQSARWRSLIARVRAVYSGHVTYCANFDEYHKIDWWDALDCVGIDAYWSLSQKTDPKDEELRAAWAAIYEDLIPFARRFGKPVCFTEIGYTASTRAAIEPWSNQMVGEDGELQRRLYRVALDEASKRPEIVGVFVWKWFTAADWQRHERQDAFAIQDEPGVIEELRAAWIDGTK